MPLLDELARKSPGKTETTTISVNQAFPDTLSILIPKLEGMTNKCTKELQDARVRSQKLMILSGKLKNKASKSDFYITGSSILRVRQTDIYNGTVKSIPGGHIKDVKKTLMDLKVKPKTIVTLIRGNDLAVDGKITQ